MRESDYYPRVARWAKEHLGCFHTATDAGLRLGRIDVVGLRDTGGNLSGRAELVSIEVKRGTQAFASSIGQASGYSIYADRVYLADLRPQGFTADEIAIATRLGVGLIRMSGETRVRLSEVVSAPPREPLEGLRQELIDGIGYATCTICSTLFRRGSRQKWAEQVVRHHGRGTQLRRAVEGEKGIVYWLEEQGRRSRRASEFTYHRRYVCPDCVWALFGHLQDE